MFPQRIGQRLSAPQKHSAVPEVVPGGDKFRRLFRVWFFGEASHAQGLALKRASRFNISIPGFRAIRPDAQHHDVRSRRRNLDAPFQSLPIALLISDHVVGREQAKHRLWILPQKQKRRQTNGWRRISPDWFGKYLGLRQLRKLLRDGEPQILVGDDPDLSRRSQREQSCHRLLNHRLLAVERQQLLRALLAAQRPKARAAPPSQNYGIEIRVLSHGFSRIYTHQNRSSTLHSRFWLRQRHSGYVRPQKLQRPLRPHTEFTDTRGYNYSVALRQRHRIHPGHLDHSASFHRHQNLHRTPPRIVARRELEWFLRFEHVDHEIRGPDQRRMPILR